MLNEQQRQVLLEVSTSCKILEQYHSDVATAYKDVHLYLENAITSKKVTMDKDNIDNITYLVALPLITMFEEMNEAKPDSPEYIYKLVMYAYANYKSKNQ